MTVTSWTKCVKLVTPSWLAREGRAWMEKREECWMWALSFAVVSTLWVVLDQKGHLTNFDHWVFFFPQSKASPGPTDSVMSGFLQYGDNPQTWQRVWSVLTRAEPPVLYLYSVPQVKCSEKVRNNNNVEGILLLRIRVKLFLWDTGILCRKYFIQSNEDKYLKCSWDCKDGMVHAVFAPQM